MTLRKIESISNKRLGVKATVYRDTEWQEYRIKFHRQEIYQENADYHTDDKSDAQHTARSFCGFGKINVTSNELIKEA